MRGDVVVPFAQGTARILTLSGVRDLEAWKRAFQDKCKDHRYYELIDETLANDFEYHYALLEDGSVLERPTTFELAEATPTSTGALIATYRPAR